MIAPSADDKFFASLTDTQLVIAYDGAWLANDRDTAWRAKREAERRGLDWKKCWPESP